MAIEAQDLQIVRHVTGRGKELSGFVITNVGQKEVLEIDPYSFRKSGGWFVREKHRQALIDAGIGLAVDGAAASAGTPFIDETINAMAANSLSSQAATTPATEFISTALDAAAAAMFQGQIDALFDVSASFGAAGGPDRAVLSPAGIEAAHAIGANQKYKLPAGAIDFLTFVSASGGAVSGNAISQEQFRLGSALAGTPLRDRSQEMLAASLSGDNERYDQIADRNFLVRIVPGLTKQEPLVSYALTSLGREYLAAGALVSEKMIAARSSFSAVNRPEPIETARASVEKIASDIGGRLSAWESSGQDVAGEWRYADLAIHESIIRIGISAGGVASINSHPFTESGEVNDSLEKIRESIVAALPTKDQRIEKIYSEGRINDAYELWAIDQESSATITDFVRVSQEKYRTPLWWLPVDTVKSWSPREFRAAQIWSPDVYQPALKALRYGTADDVITARSFEVDETRGISIGSREDMSPEMREEYEQFESRMNALESRNDRLTMYQSALLMGYDSVSDEPPAWITKQPPETLQAWKTGRMAHKEPSAPQIASSSAASDIVNAELLRMGYLGVFSFSTGTGSLSRDGLDQDAYFAGEVYLFIDGFDENSSIPSIIASIEKSFEIAYVSEYFEKIISDVSLASRHQGAIDAVYRNQIASAAKALSGMGYIVDEAAVGLSAPFAVSELNGHKQSVYLRVANDQSSLILNFNNGADIPFHHAADGSELAQQIANRLLMLDAIDDLPDQQEYKPKPLIATDSPTKADQPPGEYYETLVENVSAEVAKKSIQAFILGQSMPLDSLDALRAAPLVPLGIALDVVNAEQHRDSFNYGRIFELHRRIGPDIDLLAIGLRYQYENLVADYLTASGLPAEFDKQDDYLLVSLNQKTIEVPTHNFFSAGVVGPDATAKRLVPGVVYRLSTPPKFEPGRYPWQMSIDDFKAVCNKGIGDAVMVIDDELRNQLYINFAASAITSAAANGDEHPQRAIYLQQFTTPITDVNDFVSDFIREIEIRKGLDGSWLVLDTSREDIDGEQPSPSPTIFKGDKPAAIEFYNSYRRQQHADIAAKESLDEHIRMEEPSVSMVPPDDKSTNKPSTTGTIQDFGGYIPFAKKERAASYLKKLKDASTFDVSDVPLSKSWPEPNYTGMIEDGADPFIVGWVRAAREELPPKPRVGWKLRGWSSQMINLRDTCEKLISGDIPKDTLIEKLDSGEYTAIRDSVGFRAELYAELGHEKSFAGLRLKSANYTFFHGVSYNPAKRLWSVEQSTTQNSFGNWPKQLSTSETRSGAISAFLESAKQGDKITPPKEKKKDPSGGFAVYSQRGGSGVFISKKIGKSHPRLKEFPSAADAYAWMRDQANMEELSRIFNIYKEIPNERRLTNNERTGKDHRFGADVTPERFMETFGFYGVQFGNYVEGRRRQQDLNSAYDALMDLSDALNLPPRALSIAGQLGLAFGARGSGGKNPASAHYEPGTVVINLTKNAGAGSLAHEWWHAVDNYFSRMDGITLGYLSESKKIGRTLPEINNEFNPGVLRNAIVNAASGIVSAIRNTGMPSRSKVLDERRSSPYWSTTRELTARAFEAYVIHAMAKDGSSNDYLANIVHEKDYSLEDGYPYPLESELELISPSFKALFDCIETIEHENNTTMFSRPIKTQDYHAQPTRHDIHDIVEGVSLKLGWAKDIDVGIVDTWSELPRSLQDEVVQKRAFNLAGAFHNGKIWLVCDNIQSHDHALHTILHEGCHKGLSALLGNKSDEIMLEIYNSNQKIKTLADDLINKHADLSPAKATEECLADIAGNQEWKNIPLYDKVIALAKDAIRSISDLLPERISSLLSLDSWTDRDVAQIADKAVLSLRSYNEVGRLGFSPGATAMLSRSYDNVERRDDQINSPHWALVKEGRIITSGNSTGMTADYLAVLAKGNGAEGVLLSNESFAPGTRHAEDTKRLIFGRTWQEISAMQHGSPASHPTLSFAAVSDDAIRSMLRVSELEPSEIKRLIEKADSIEEGFPSAKSFSPGM